MEEICDLIYEKYTSIQNLHSGLCMFTMGIPASGKTTNAAKVLKEFGIKNDNIIHLDPDNILEELRTIIETSNLQLLNKQSVIISSKIFNRIINSEEQFSVIYYGTGKSWASYQTMINKAKKYKYNVGLINVTLDLETAIKRNSLRKRTVGRNVIVSINNRLKKPLSNKKTPKKYIGKTNFEVLSSLVDFVYNIDSTNISTTIIRAKGKEKKKKKSKKKKNL